MVSNSLRLIVVTAMMLGVAGPRAEAAFAPPVTVSPAGYRSERPVLASSPDGASVVGWTQASTRSSRSTIGWAAVDPGGDPRAPSDLGDGLYPATAIDGDGTTTLAWRAESPGGEESYIRYIRINAGGTAGPVQTAVTSPDSIGSVRADVDSTGRVTLAYLNVDLSYSIFKLDAVRLSPAGVAGEPFTVTRAKEFLGDANLSIDDRDRAVFAWRVRKGDWPGRQSIRAVVARPDGSVGADHVAIPSRSRQTLDRFDVSGRRIAAIRHLEGPDGAERRLVVVQLGGDGAPVSRQVIARHAVGRPHIATRTNGRSIIAWSNPHMVRLTSVNVDGKVSRARTISRDSASVGAVDLPPSGEVVVWGRENREIDFSRIDNRGQADPATVAVRRDKEVTMPVVDSDDDRKLTLVWLEDHKVFVSTDP